MLYWLILWVQMGEVQAQLQAQQTQAAALQQALQAAQAQHAQVQLTSASRPDPSQDTSFLHSTEKIKCVVPALLHYHVWLPQLLLTFLDVLQSIARTEYLERINAYQSAELTKMQREVYHLRSLLSSHGVDLALVRSSCKHAVLWMTHANVLWFT